MRPRRLRLAALVVTAGSLLATAAPARTEAPSAADRFRQVADAKLASAGLTFDDIAALPVTLEIWGETGLRRTTRPFGEIVARFGDLDAPLTGEGPYGTPETVGGNLSHLFAGFWAGAEDEGDARCPQVRVHRSTTVPDTYAAAATVSDATGVPVVNPIPVTGAPLYLTPIPDATSPVIPASSWAVPAYLWLGPTLHITARYDLGMHTVGTLLGSNISTDTSGPDPYPVWTPMTTTGFVADGSIDFLGQGLFASAGFDESFFGYRVCGAFGALVLSNGAAIFDNHPVLGLDPAFPDLP